MSSQSPIRSPKPLRVLLFLAVFAVGAIGLAVTGITDRAKSRQEVATWTNEQAVPTVHLVRPERGPDQQDLVLPGNVAAFSTAPFSLAQAAI
jgi:membrane fusion protein (multidrug efflux system)